MQYLLPYVVALIVGLVIDAFWLGFVARSFYANNIGHLMASHPNWLAAGLFYLLFVVAIVYFVVAPALQNNASIMSIIISGAMLGLIAYGTYDLTNQATLRDWPWIVTIVDLAWGAFLTATISVLTVWVVKWFS
jgi:uncharacterized membrane protein